MLPAPRCAAQEKVTVCGPGKQADGPRTIALHMRSAYFAAGAAAIKVVGGAAAVASGTDSEAVALWPPS